MGLGWEVGPKKWWEVGLRLLGDGRLGPKTGGIWEYDTPGTPSLICIGICLESYKIANTWLQIHA